MHDRAVGDGERYRHLRQAPAGGEITLCDVRPEQGEVGPASDLQPAPGWVVVDVGRTSGERVDPGGGRDALIGAERPARRGCPGRSAGRRDLDLGQRVGGRSPTSRCPSPVGRRTDAATRRGTASRPRSGPRKGIVSSSICGSLGAQYGLAVRDDAQGREARDVVGVHHLQVSDVVAVVVHRRCASRAARTASSAMRTARSPMACMWTWKPAASRVVTADASSSAST